MAAAPFAAAADRNAAPILEALEIELRSAQRVLEIGSGTGQHAVRFGARLRWLEWQTSDLAENHAAIQAWIDESGLSNILPPLALDVLDEQSDLPPCDAVFSANTAHIMPIVAVERMFGLAGTVLEDGGLFCLYGPFRFAQRFSTPSNASFDAALRERDPAMGIRDLERLDGFARESGLTVLRRYAMPANNELVIWRKR